ncbi:hypothetical protein [Janthinobacterium sp. RB2R34]|uniref:hypothetical protein n=1 Tax=Janthinobacterium sp. RB2R34 TaxID=3424193 RepID=UPI003F245413
MAASRKRSAEPCRLAAIQALQAAKLTVRHMPEVKRRCFVYSSVIAARRNALRQDSTDFSGYFVCANEIVFGQLTQLAFFCPAGAPLVAASPAVEFRYNTGLCGRARPP